MVADLTIKLLDANKGIYYCGDVIRGVVELNLKKPKVVKALYIDIIGDEDVSWSEFQLVRSNEKNRREFKNISYTGKEQHVDTQIFLVGENNAAPTSIHSGEHSYAFRCQLPNELPPTVEGKHGRICYKIKVTYARPRKADEIHEKSFTVHQRLDLSGSYTEPIEKEKTEMFYRFPLTKAPFTVIATIASRGFVEGSPIPVTVKIINKSKNTVHFLKIALRQIITFRSTSPEVKLIEEIIKINKLQVDINDEQEIGTYQRSLIVPSLPSSMVNTGLITIGYEIKVDVKVSGFNQNPVIRVPITIGTTKTQGIPMCPPYPINDFLNATAPLPSSTAPPSYDQTLQNQSLPTVVIGWNT